MKRNLLCGTLAVVVGFPLGWIAAMMMTPVLWRLEGIFHVELAGHSGPSDWVFYLVWAVIVPGLFVLFRVMVFRRSSLS